MGSSVRHSDIEMRRYDASGDPFTEWSEVENPTFPGLLKMMDQANARGIRAIEIHFKNGNSVEFRLIT